MNYLWKLLYNVLIKNLIYLNTMVSVRFSKDDNGIFEAAGRHTTLFFSRERERERK